MNINKTEYLDKYFPQDLDLGILVLFGKSKSYLVTDHKCF